MDTRTDNWQTVVGISLVIKPAIRLILTFVFPATWLLAIEENAAMADGSYLTLDAVLFMTNSFSAWCPT